MRCFMSIPAAHSPLRAGSTASSLSAASSARSPGHRWWSRTTCCYAACRSLALPPRCRRAWPRAMLLSSRGCAVPVPSSSASPTSTSSAWELPPRRRPSGLPCILSTSTRTAVASSAAVSPPSLACEVPMAVCTDTRGSIREPAAQCGIVGVKPSHCSFPQLRCDPVRFEPLPGLPVRLVRPLLRAPALGAGPRARAERRGSRRGRRPRPDSVSASASSPSCPVLPTPPGVRLRLYRVLSALDRLGADVVYALPASACPSRSTAYYAISSLRVRAHAHPVRRRAARSRGAAPLPRGPRTPRRSRVRRPVSVPAPWPPRCTPRWPPPSPCARCWSRPRCRSPLRCWASASTTRCPRRVPTA